MKSLISLLLVIGLISNLSAQTEIAAPIGTEDTTFHPTFLGGAPFESVPLARFGGKTWRYENTSWPSGIFFGIPDTMFDIITGADNGMAPPCDPHHELSDLVYNQATSNLSAGVVRYTGTTPYIGGNLPARISLTFKNYPSNTPLELHHNTADNNFLIPVEGDFEVNVIIEMGSPYSAAVDYFDADQGTFGYTICTSFDTDYAFKFYSACEGINTNTVFVDQSKNGIGASWSTATGNLAEAFYISNVCSVDTVKIAEGTYYPIGGWLGNDNSPREDAFEIKDKTVILGGYSAATQERDWSLYPTILSGDIGLEDTVTDNSYTILNIVTLADSSTLEGLILEHGYADGNPLEYRTGAALFSNHVIVDIKNCTFRNNSAVGNGSTGVGGGLISYGGEVTLTNNLWYNNFASSEGGALSVQTGTVHIINNTLAKNEAASNGGGIQSYNGILHISNSIFSGNAGNVKNIYNPGLGASIDVNYCMFDDTLEANVINLGNSLFSTVAGFNDSINHDYRLSPCSPGLNIGLDSVNMSNSELSNQSRFVDQIDLGAYESKAKPFLGTNIVYVDKSKSGGGSNWTEATPYLQHAIDICHSCDVDTILIAEGYYFPDEGMKIDNYRSYSFTLDSGTIINGSFPSGGGHPDIANHPTILSGEIGDTMTTDDNTKTIMALNANCHVDRIIFEDGNAGDLGDAGGPGRDGGGLHTSKGGHFTNLIFRNNSAVIGGGFYAIWDSFIMKNCLFHDNYAYAYGGAIGMDFISLSDTSILENITISQNSNDTSAFGTDGSAIAVFTSIAQIENSNIYFNPVPFRELGGGKLYMNYTNVEGGFAGISNLDVDPLFIDTITNDFRLRYMSPLIDVGNDSAVTSSVDLVGNDRVIKDSVDLGAFEFNYEFPCDIYSTLVIDDLPVYTGKYKASGLITSKGLVNLNSLGDVSYKSELSIELLSDFEVELGQTFEAVIESPCVD